MARIFVDFNKLDSVENDIFNAWMKVGEEKRNFKNTIDKLDWEVKSQERILRRSQQVVKKLDDITQCLDSYSKFLLNCYSNYEMLENFEKIADIDKIEIVQPTEGISDTQKLQNYLDTAGSVLTDKRKAEIEKRFENATEPGKSILTKYMQFLNIDNEYLNESVSKYSRSDGKIHLVKNETSIVVYHETGHAISQSGLNTEVYDFKAYSEYMQKEATIYETIDYDVYWNMDNEYSVARIYSDMMKEQGKEYNEFTLALIINSIRQGKMPSVFSCNEEYRIARDIEKKIEKMLRENDSVNDLYGGASQNRLLGWTKFGWGKHPDTYWDNLDDDSGKPYMDSATAQISTMEQDRHLSEEAWAHYFEGYFKNDNGEYMQQLQKALPATYELLTKYAETLV